MPSRKNPPQLKEGMTARTLTMRAQTYREADDSVEFVLTTEQPALVWDWKRWRVIREITVASGFSLYSGNQIPLLDSHSRHSVSNIYGSVREIRAEGNQVVGRVYFSKSKEAQEALQKVREGHLTTGSIGYSQAKSTLIKKGEKAVVNGKEYDAGDADDLLVTTDWTLLEFSLVAIPADNNATVREECAGNGAENTNLSGSGAEKELTEMTKKPDTPAVEAEKPAEVIDLEAVKAEAVKAEQTRAAKITEICTKHGCTELQAELIRSGASIEAAQDKVLSAIETRTSVSVARIEVGETDTEKKREMYVDNILARAGLEDKPEANKGLGLADIARSCLRDAGIVAYDIGKIEALTRAMGTSDFPIVLANVANKSVLKGFNIGKSTWRIWAKKGSLSDFKAARRVDLSAAPELKRNLPGEEIEQGIMGERGESLALETFARVMIITREALINDDVGLFNDIFFRFGQRAANQIEAAVYYVLTASPLGQVMDDGKAVFHATRSNTNSTNKGIVQSSSVQEALTLMSAQKDPSGAIMGPMGKYILGGIENMVPAQLLCTSVTDPTANSNASVNPFKKEGLVPVITPHITGKGWYLATDEIDTVEVAFLDGKDVPTLYSVKNDGDILGQKFVAYIDYKAKVLEYRGLVRCPAS